jgi:predicted ABC-type exoprotein transport system permease subunit
MIKQAFIISFVLTLASWVLVYFTMPKAPLNGPDTTAVFGIWLALALLGLWLHQRLGKRKSHGG